jgi:hypothetical protein
MANIGRLGKVGVQASPAVFRGTLKAGAKLWNTHSSHARLVKVLMVW